MPTWTGTLDNSGSPLIKISVYGVLKARAIEFDAIVDTGFTGFLSMPMVEAFPLGLVLAGTTTTVLADGSLSNKLVALGTAAVGGEEQLGSILLNIGNGPSAVLIGMEFLRVFQKTLLLFGQGVALIDNSEIQAVIQQATSPPPPPNP
jgi:predicted aspartyl protease